MAIKRRSFISRRVEVDFAPEDAKEVRKIYDRLIKLGYNRVDSGIAGNRLIMFKRQIFENE